MMEVCRIGEWLALVRICPADPSPYIIRRCRRKVANMSTLAKARLICADERCNASDVVVAQFLVHPRLDHGLRWWFVSEPGTSLLLVSRVSRLASRVLPLTALRLLLPWSIRTQRERPIIQALLSRCGRCGRWSPRLRMAPPHTPHAVREKLRYNTTYEERRGSVAVLQ